MARSFTMAPQAPHTSAAKQPPAKHPPAAPGRGPHNAHPSHPAHRGGLGGWITLVVIAAAAAAGLWFWLGGAPAVDASTQLLTQMEAAAQGSAAPTHVFGGALTVSRANGRASVVAENVPSRACVQVGWRLAREGTIIVNGTLPTRLSAAKLSDLCSGDAATLMWVPDE
ncbi:MAG: hypothetical protein ACM31D_11615 [Bacteroidota bacterium]